MAKTKEKPIDKKTEAPKTASSRKPAASTKITRAKKSKNDIGRHQRYEMIQTAAYFIAENNGFKGDLREFWIEAEKQIDRMLAK